MNILVLNGPNLNLLGLREPELYGRGTLAQLTDLLRQEGKALGVTLDFYQSNHEGDLVDAIQGAYGRMDGIIFNPAAYTHTSVALHDALKAVGIPTVEVHLTNPDDREPFRRINFIRPACIATVAGKGFAGYVEALRLLCRLGEEQK